MEAITITLNGREVSGRPGMTVLDLARESGIEIPTLCHDPLLEPIGACRICIVEEERSGALMASCVTPIAPGMVIDTQSPRVQERRKTIIKLMLASHPDSCLVCDKGNRCQLREIAAEMSVGLVDFHKIPQPATVQEVNPFIERDLSKCILCAKCIRACQELVGQGVVDYLGRGFVSKPATLGDLPLEKSECTFCGTCVALCPTGAIMEKEKIYRGTGVTSVRTICPYCGCGCSICLEIRDNHLVRVKPYRDNPLNRSILCVKGSYGCDFMHSPERLSRPLVKVNGNFKEVSWDEALTVVADEFKRIKETSGSKSLAVFGSSKCTNEENYILQKFARCVLGTNNVDNGSRLYGPAGLVALYEATGMYPNVDALENLERSEVILVIGADPSSSLPPVEYAIKRAVRRRGTKLLVIDPRGTKLTAWAHIWLRPKLGTDAAVLNSMARVIIYEGLFDKEYIENRTDNFGAFTETLKHYTTEYVEAVSSISAEEIRQSARLFATARQASIVYGSGITQHFNGASCVAALLNLAMLTGANGDGRNSIYELTWENNGQGACDMGTLPNFLPGYRSIKDAQARERFGSRWGCQLPMDEGLTALEMIIGIREGKINGMYIVGENPAVSFPHSTLVRQALESLEFLVVQDMFLTETAKLARVVLPAASFAEKEGTVTSFDGAVQKLRKALEPPGDSLPDWEIILKLSRRMDYPMSYTSPEEIMAEIAELVPSYQAVNYAFLERRGYCFREREFSNKPRHFSIVEHVSPEDSADGYPYTLLTGTVLHQFGSGSRSLRSSRLKRFSPEAFLEMSEFDAKSLKVQEGDKVRVISPVGVLTAMVKINETLDAGMVFMPVSFPERPASGLFEIVLDPVTKLPALKVCRVKLEKVGNHG